MILKLLLTLAVIIAVYIWYRRKNGQRLLPASLSASILASRSPAKQLPSNSWVKPFAYAIAGLVIIVGIWIYYLSWQEGHTQYEVTITNPQSGSTETFIALKKNMKGRLFITETGREIRTSELERVEVRKLADKKIEDK
ncbi:MAG: hypothetical protein V7765_11900 [Oleispira sp.]